MNIRKHLSASGLFNLVRAGLEKVKDTRTGEATILMVDVLMSAFAMFSLKDDSLRTFDQRRANPRELANLKRVYGIENVPCDTVMRDVLDPVDPEEFRPIFKNVFNQLQRGKVLEKFQYMGGYYILSGDGTGYFSSKKIHCPSCLERINSKTGEITYSHQMYGAAIVHPNLKEVIPLMPEPIIKQDGETKNDCERNASKRFFDKFRQDHPNLPVIVVEDALSSNAPHIRELQKHNLRYILGVKKGDHEFLFEQIEEACKKEEVEQIEIEEEDVTHRFHFINDLPLNKSNQDVRVNYVEYWEIKKEKTQHFSWTTDFVVTKDNVYDIMRGGRARWKIENETFNTLKNKNYNFEHNYGHGNINLSVNFALLMMLAFLVDQAQQLACSLFQAVLEKEGSKKTLWEHVRNLFYALDMISMEQIYQAILYGYKIERIVILNDTS
ncbi:MAG: transposase [Ardenticatenaceae bacterium]